MLESTDVIVWQFEKYYTYSFSLTILYIYIYISINSFIFFSFAKHFTSTVFKQNKRSMQFK